MTPCSSLATRHCVHRVGSVPSLSSEPVFRRSHRSLYTALARGGIDEEALRQRGAGLLLPGVAPLRPTAQRGGLVLPVDHPARLGARPRHRATRRHAHRAQRGCHHGDHRAGATPGRAARRRRRRGDVRLRRRPRRHRPGSGPRRHPGAGADPHQLQAGLSLRPRLASRRHRRAATPPRRPLRAIRTRDVDTLTSTPSLSPTTTATATCAYRPGTDCTPSSTTVDAAPVPTHRRSCTAP